MAFNTDDTFAVDKARQAIVWAKQLRADCVKYIAQCDAGSLNVHDVAAAFMANHLAPIKTGLAATAAVSGIYDALVFIKPGVWANAAAAQTAFASAQTGINNMILFLEGASGIPIDGSRRILSLILSNDGSGTLTQRTITNGAQLATFKTQLETLRDALSAS